MKVNTKQLLCLIAVLAILPFSAVCDDTTTTTTSSTYEIEYDDYIKFHWKGDVTSTSITFKVVPSLTSIAASSYTNSFIVIYTKSTTDSTVTFVQAQLLTYDASADKDYPVGTLTVTGLTASTKYYYCFVFGTTSTAPAASDFSTLYPSGDSSMSGEEWPFTTHALALTQNSFTFGVGCCAQTNSSNEVFDSMADQNLDFFVQTGNMFYDAISTSNATLYNMAYTNVFTSSKQKAFYEQTPIVYAWDEYDYGAAGSNGNSVTKLAATTAYKKFVPATNLKAAFPTDDSANGGTSAVTPTSSTTGYQTYDSTSTGAYGIFRSFLVGRCMFILLDLRSFKDITANDILGSSQLAWFQNQFLYASLNSNIRQIFLISSLPWNNKASKTEWTTYASTQTSVHGWIVSIINGTSYSVKQKVMLLGGGASMVAFDDGSNNANGKFPVVQAGGLDQTASCAGGSYSHGLVSGRQQYGIITVTDNGGDTICVKVNLTRTGTALIVYDSCSTSTAMTQTTKTCPASLISTITDYVSGGSWVWFILIMVVIFIIVGFVLYKVWLVYKQRREDAANEGEENHDYIEMEESKKKQKTDLVL